MKSKLDIEFVKFDFNFTIKSSKEFIHKTPWFVFCNTSEELNAFTKMMKKEYSYRYDSYQSAPVFLSNCYDLNSYSTEHEMSNMRILEGAGKDYMKRGKRSESIGKRIQLPLEYIKENDELICRIVSNEKDPVNKEVQNNIKIQIESLENKMQQAIDILKKLEENRSQLIKAYGEL